MSDCRYGELLSGFIDDQLTEEQTTTLLDHLGKCDSCRTGLEALVTIHDAFRRGEVFPDAPAISSDFVAGVMEQLPLSPVAYEPECPSAAVRYLTPLVDFFRFRPALTGAAAMAAVLLTVGSFYLYPVLTQPTLQQVSDIQPHVMVTQSADRDIYYHTRLDAAYTVGGAPLPIDHTLEERF